VSLYDGSMNAIQNPFVFRCLGVEYYMYNDDDDVVATAAVGFMAGGWVGGWVCV